ncbi:MAG: hypothetical protein GXP37_07315 [Chloroflexi bacterium]|nr:hypothetical protein [Chloroflexota bacterium]
MPDPINDATAYDVRIVAAEVTHGATYWKVIRVHHLTPEENQGRHHIFIDALDEEGLRLYGAKVLIEWDGGSETVVIDKPATEPGANLPMWKWQVCAAAMLDMPSDRVENLRTDHPDEGSGNTLFHHSFEIVFQRAVAAGVAEPSDGRLSGKVPDGAGHTIALFLDGEQIATTAVGDDEQYQFAHLVAGEYLCRDTDDGREVGPVSVDGEHETLLDFGEAPAPRPIARYMLFDAEQTLLAPFQLELVADYLAENVLTFGFSVADASQAREVMVVGEQTDAILQALHEAGCQVTPLPADPGALLKALKTP